MTAASARTDVCGNPAPDVCTPSTVRTPICYLTTTLQALGVVQGIPGVMIIAVDEDCNGVVTGIEDLHGNVIGGAFQVPCLSTLGTGGFGEGEGNGPGAEDLG